MLLPDDGDRLLAIDLSQIDARAMGAHSQDAGYLDALARSYYRSEEYAVEKGHAKW